MQISPLFNTHLIMGFSMHTLTYGDHALSIRDPKLDSQRSKLIKVILTIPDNLNQDQLKHEAPFIQKICIDHFSYEELSMSKDNYPLLKAHSEQHLNVQKEINHFSNMSVENTGVGTGRRLKRYLLSWFDEHSEEYDQKYLEFRQKRDRLVEG